MKNKKYFILILSLIVSGVLFLATTVLAEEVIPDSAPDSGKSYLDFKPQVSIPGTEFEGQVNKETNERIVHVRTGDAIATYIISLYKYGAGIAGLVALFMVVLAGWKWLMAAGSSEKISSAKDTIQGAVIGLFLLFGGYLLLSQISENLVSFDTLVLPVVETIAMDDDYCRANPSWPPGSSVTASCGEVSYSTTSPSSSFKINCISDDCLSISPTAVCIDKNSGLACASSIPITDNSPFCGCYETQCSKLDFWVYDPDHKTSENNCYGYKTKKECIENACLNQTDVGGHVMTNICGWDMWCKPMEDISCDSNYDCQNSLTDDEWCCEKQRFIGIGGWVGGLNKDNCRKRSETDNCYPN